MLVSPDIKTSGALSVPALTPLDAVLGKGILETPSRGGNEQAPAGCRTLRVGRKKKEEGGGGNGELPVIRL